MSSVTPHIPNADSAPDYKQASHLDSRLLPSALFFTANCAVPAGIHARDMSAMVQGLVEEHAPLPIEQTSWGFILDNTKRKKSHFFYYAAPRDLIFKSTTEANDLSLRSVIPAFAATTGLNFKQNTWLCLLESECLSLIHFESDSSIPDQIHSHFLPIDDAPNSAETLRSDLIAQHVGSNPGEIIDGFIAIESAVSKGKKGIQFKLVQAPEANGRWTQWKQTTIAQPTRLIAADLRTKETLSGRLQRNQSGKRIMMLAVFVALAVITLGAFEYLQIKQKAEAHRLTELAEEQEPLVNRLKEVETMTKSLKNLFQKEFQPFHWLMVANEARPENLSISSYAFDEAGILSANGEATEVKALNLYVDALKINPKFKSATIANLNTDNSGVTFSLQLEAGDLHAEPPLEAEPASPPAAEPAVEEPSIEVAPETAPAAPTAPIQKEGAQS
ncbi:hypothetical protein ACWPKS_06690 [Coraliomargarita sp. W4R72]